METSDFQIKTEKVDIEDQGLEYNGEGYDGHREDFNNYSEDPFSNTEPRSLSNSNYPVDICNLCGAIGKLFVRIGENKELASKLQKHMPFVDVQQNDSDCFCYQCSSTVDSWHGFYQNCSLVNAKLKKKCEPKNTVNRKSESSSNEPVNNIIRSYDRLNSNPSSENFLQTMGVLANSLKSLINDMERNPSNHSESQNSMAFFDGTSQMIEENPTFSQKIELPEINLDEVSRNVEYKPNLLEEKPVTRIRQTRNVEYNYKPLMEKPAPKKIEQFQSYRNGTWFCDNVGYCFRVNKRRPGKIYVRCTEMSCPVRGCIHKNIFRSNKHTHTHPPNKDKHTKYFASTKPALKSAVDIEGSLMTISEEVIFHPLIPS